MARYTIDFSTNASRIADEIQKVNKAVAETTKKGKQNKITLELDTTKLRTSIDSTFRELDKQIAAMQRKLAGMQIGSRRFQQQATGIGVAQGMRERGGMQARAIQLGAQAEAFDIGSATRLTKQLEAARIEASQIAPNTEPWINLQRQIGRLKVDLQAADRLAENVQMRESLGAFEPGSLNALEAKLTILRNRAREIAPNTTKWKKVNAEIVKTEQSIEKQTRRPLTTGQRMGAAGGAFLYGGGLGGGVGSAAGGIAGGLIGGVPGAFTGAAVGQAVDNLSAMAFAMTEQANAVRRMRLGLASASTDLKDFAEANALVADISNRLLIPLGDSYRQFTRLRASTVALGIDTKTTGEIFEGVSTAVMMTGGSMEDVDGAMRAVSQVFSKGKVTAEELRGQLGERLPGAVVKFAKENIDLSDERFSDYIVEKNKVKIGDKDSGENSNIISSIQSKLESLNYTMSAGVDGVYGKQTEEAVKKFQKENNLQETGEVDSITYLSLVNPSAKKNTEKKEITKKVETSSGTSSSKKVDSGSSDHGGKIQSISDGEVSAIKLFSSDSESCSGR